MQQHEHFLTKAHTSGVYQLGVGVHNAATARLVEQAGFDLLWLSSLEVSTAKALPDVNLITPVEVAEITREISRATRLPLIVDSDNGYGSHETAVRAAQEFECAGAAAMCIEDNSFPKRNSFHQSADRQLEDRDVFARRISLIRTALRNDQFGLIARTEGLIAGEGVASTLERVRAYVDAGATAIFVQVNQALFEEFTAVLAETRQLAPIVITPTALPDLTAPELHAMGADIIIYANVVIRAITRALGHTLTDLRQAEALGPIHGQIASLQAIFDLAGTSAAFVEAPTARRAR